MYAGVGFRTGYVQGLARKSHGRRGSCDQSTYGIFIRDSPARPCGVRWRGLMVGDSG